MSQTIILELSDDDFAAIRQEAVTTGRTPAEVIVAELRQHGILAAGAAAERRQATSTAVRTALAQMVQETAARTGQTIDDVATAWRAGLMAHVSRQRTEEDERITRARLGPFRGAVSSGDQHSADNERIDADLAAEYAGTHDEDG